MIRNYDQRYSYMETAVGEIHTLRKNDLRWISTSEYIQDERIESYLGDLLDGGVVLDRRPCRQRHDYYRWSVFGPMINDRLPPCSVSQFHRGMRSSSDARNHDALDFVSLDLYLDLWRWLGAIPGVRKHDRIVWENGKESLIIPAESRFQ